MAQKKNEQKKPAGNSAGQKSKSSGAVKARSQSAARPAGVNAQGQKAGQSAGVSPQRQRSERTPQAPAPENNSKPVKDKGNVGKVYRGTTKYIDVETKSERDYVVVLDDGQRVSVAKLKSIKIFDANDKNADKALVEINATRYGLEKRTGVDFQVFSKNRMSGKPLQINDKDVFPEGKERFKLGSHDLNRTLVHTGRALRGKKKRGK